MMMIQIINTFLRRADHSSWVALSRPRLPPEKGAKVSVLSPAHYNHRHLLRAWE
jgi:hypothetical protein